MPKRYRTKKIKGRSTSEHRWIWEQAHGPIPASHLVHHINGDKRDNRIENLELMTHQQHSEHHNQKHAKKKACEWCRNEFTPHPTKRARAKTCSPACRYSLTAVRKSQHYEANRAPCGTVEGYSAHWYRREAPCDPCRAAKAERSRQERRAA